MICRIHQIDDSIFSMFDFEILDNKKMRISSILLKYYDAHGKEI